MTIQFFAEIETREVHGGVFLAVHNSIPTKPIIFPPNLEIVAAEVIQTGYIVCATYFPPNN